MSRLTISGWMSVLMIAVVCVLSESFGRQASVSEGTQVFRTYPFGDPDPVARMSNIYPYFRFEGYSITPTEKEWKVVTLENPYIKVLVAPEIGGKILGAFEKLTGRAFIYFNRVVKFREIAMRGPWTSGGIEFNFGDIGHTPATATPVDYLTRTNDDSSVSCIVGSIDLPSRTEWRVEIRLPKDKAYFQTESFWYNPTDLNTSLYHWMNAAADATPDLRFIYPGTGYIDHGGGAFPWPATKEGREISVYANNNFASSKSYHVLGTYTDTYAAYWHDADFGVVHWSPYADKPGKKIWIWALSREGEIWKDLLTDPALGNNQYVEIQSGLLLNQAGGSSSRTPFKHQFLAPLSEENFVEAWFPFKNIGGMVASNLSGTLNVERVGSYVKFGFCPLGRTVQPLVVTVAGKEVLRRDLSLRPLQIYRDSVRVEAQGEIEVRVGDLLTYRSGDQEERKLDRPVVANKDFDWNSVQGLFTDGVERARQRDYLGALERYEACLAKEPAHSGALAGAAEIYYRRMEYEKALLYAQKALANDAYDPDANFIYGVINRKLGRIYDALDGFGTASRSMKYRSAANAEMAELFFMQKDWPAAEAHAFRSLDYDRSGVRASRLLVVLYRLQSSSADARNAIAHLSAIDPLSHLASFERYLLDKSPAKLADFKSGIKGELPQESYLELASYYFNLRLYDDAIAVLQQSPPYPIVWYWLAYLSEMAGKGGAEHYLASALEAPIALVFPFRTETAEVLTWAAKKKSDWKTTYYLALIHWHKDRVDLAREELLACRDESREASFYLTRSKFFTSHKGGDPGRDLRRALELGGDEWRPYQALIEFYIGQAEYGEALKIARRLVDRFPASYIALFNYARSLLYAMQPEKCASILDTLVVLPFEGARYTRDLNRQACILSAARVMKSGRYDGAVKYLLKAREWPERLGVGKPYDVDNRFEDFLEAICCEKLGDKSRASTLKESVAAYTRTHSGDWGPGRLFGALSMRALGRENDAERMLDGWMKQGVPDGTRWLVALFNRNLTEAREAEKKLRGGSSVSLLGRNLFNQELALAIEVHTILSAAQGERIQW
jgi:tetratricopeptide (TPR) repeat protein